MKWRKDYMFLKDIQSQLGGQQERKSKYYLIVVFYRSKYFFNIEDSDPLLFNLIDKWTGRNI